MVRGGVLGLATTGEVRRPERSYFRGNSIGGILMAPIWNKTKLDGRYK